MSIALPQLYAQLKCSTEDPPGRCDQCRRDRQWRRDLVSFYGGPIDFDCEPRGLPIIGQVTDEVLPHPSGQPHHPPTLASEPCPPPSPAQLAARAAQQRAIAAFRAGCDILQINMPGCGDGDCKRMISAMGELGYEKWIQERYLDVEKWLTKSLKHETTAIELETFISAVKEKWDSIEDTTIEKKEIPNGPGLLLSQMIKETTGEDSSECHVCHERALKMNSWGFWACFTTHRKEILGWLEEKMKEKGIEPDPVMILKAFRGACKYFLTSRRDHKTNPIEENQNA